MALVEIDPNAVHVRFLRPLPVDEQKHYQRSLSDDEIRRAERFHFEHDRRLYLAARALVRRTLSRYFMVEPAAWRFNTDSYGRPYILSPVEARALRFSSSRTAGLVACAVTLNRDIGVDVEYSHELPHEVLDSCFTPSEATFILDGSGNEQSDRFFAHWTLKESYVKARGFGLSFPLEKFAIRLNDDQAPRLDIDPVLDDRAPEWRFLSMQPTRAHRAAISAHFPDHDAMRISCCWDELSD